MGGILRFALWKLEAGVVGWGIGFFVARLVERRQGRGEVIGQAPPHAER